MYGEMWAYGAAEKKRRYVQSICVGCQGCERAADERCTVGFCIVTLVLSVHTVGPKDLQCTGTHAIQYMRYEGRHQSVNNGRRVGGKGVRGRGVGRARFKRRDPH